MKTKHLAYLNILLSMVLTCSCLEKESLSSTNPWDKEENTGNNEDDNPGTATETLYNGIVMPDVWPPRVDMFSTEPMYIPYLENRPETVPIDVGRQLFVDDFLIESTDLKRVCHQAVKYSGNPVFFPENILEIPSGHFPGAGPKDGGIWWEPRQNRFMMWYEAGWLNTMALATSPDGLEWERPSISGSANELSSRKDLVPNSCAVVLDYDAPDAERYKIFFRQPNAQADKMNACGHAMVSSDGITWTGRTMSGSCGDRSTMFYNPFRKKWIFSLRSNRTIGYPNSDRVRYYHEHDNFLEGAAWDGSNTVFWCRADKYDTADPEIGQAPQLYNLNAVAYESLMLGLFQILIDENDVAMAAGRPKVTVLKTAFSRDGFHWSRPDHEPFIDATRTVGKWDRGYIQSVGGICAVMKDQLWFWYIGFKGDENRPGHSASLHSDFSTGIAYLRRDGFCSMSTDGTSGNSGELITRPVTFSGRYLFVNTDCPDGSLKVEVLDKDNKVISGYSRNECTAISENSTITQVKWSGKSDLSGLSGQEIRFRFILENCALYSFWVSPSENGESMGYVAGGGPGYTGNIDDKGITAYNAASSIPPLQ